MIISGGHLVLVKAWELWVDHKWCTLSVGCALRAELIISGGNLLLVAPSDLRVDQQWTLSVGCALGAMS